MELHRARQDDWALQPLISHLNRWKEEGVASIFCVTSLSGADRLQKLLLRYDCNASLHRDAASWRDWGGDTPEIRIARISEGFVLPAAGIALVTEEEIFGPREKPKHGQSIREFSDASTLKKLAPGDCG